MKRLLKNIYNIFWMALGFFVGGRQEPSPKASPGRPPRPSGDPEPAPSERWKRLLKHWAALLALLSLAGILVMASGIISIKASSGHWAITRWFLTFAKQRSVSTHAVGIEVPPLDDEALVLKGAGHYETGCRPCHGSPGLPSPRITQFSTPQPPFLRGTSWSWNERELFYIVKHGLKFTGMPAWPAQNRDDEVWTLVAFLRAMPAMDADAYRALVHGAEKPDRPSPPPAPPDTTAAPADTTTTAPAAPLQSLLPPQDVPLAVTQSCARCHGKDGLGRGLGAFPRLAGQPYTYLFNALQSYENGLRPSGIMAPIAAGFTREQHHALAQFFAGLPPGSPPGVSSPAAVERGRRIASDGIPDRGVPSCIDCHGPGQTARNPAYPLLAGQYASYLTLQLELFQKGHRGGSPFAGLMAPAVHRLTPEQMSDVAAYYQSLPANASEPDTAPHAEREE